MERGISVSMTSLVTSMAIEDAIPIRIGRNRPGGTKNASAKPVMTAHKTRIRFS